MKFINVTIDPQGRPKIEAEGFQGVGCKAATKPLEDALSDGKTNIVEDKPEVFMSTGNSIGTGLLA